jgi:hypothetical protein
VATVLWVLPQQQPRRGPAWHGIDLRSSARGVQRRPGLVDTLGERPVFVELGGDRFDSDAGQPQGPRAGIAQMASKPNRHTPFLDAKESIRLSTLQGSLAKRRNDRSKRQFHAMRFQNLQFLS